MGQHTSPNSKTSGTRNSTQHANSTCWSQKMYSTPGLETLFVWWCQCWPSVNSLPLSGIPPLASHASSHRVSELLPHTHTHLTSDHKIHTNTNKQLHNYATCQPICPRQVLPAKWLEIGQNWSPSNRSWWNFTAFEWEKLLPVTVQVSESLNFCSLICLS